MPGPRRRLHVVARMIAIGAGVVAGAYAGSVGITWWRYGAPPPPASDADDPMLDRFMPAYEVVERHQIRVEAPPAITLAAAREQDLFGSPVIRTIFKARELILGGTPDHAQRPRALLPQMLSLGWGVLGEVPGCEIVVGAVTKPWEPNVVFRALPPGAFAAFSEPEHVKIVWSLRVDPDGANRSIFRTETRAIATDTVARAKFRRYWSFVSPGVAMIRRLSLKPMKADAERRARATSPQLRASQRS